MQTSKFKNDLSSLKTRVYSLRSENHVKAPEIEDLDWMDDYMATQKQEEKAMKIPKKLKAEVPLKESGNSHYLDLKNKFNVLMK